MGSGPRWRASRTLTQWLWNPAEWRARCNSPTTPAWLGGSATLRRSPHFKSRVHASQFAAQRLSKGGSQVRVQGLEGLTCLLSGQGTFGVLHERRLMRCAYEACENIQSRRSHRELHRTIASYSITLTQAFSAHIRRLRFQASHAHSTKQVRSSHAPRH